MTRSRRLLEGMGSKVEAERTAVAVRGAAPVGVTTALTQAAAPLERLPRVQVNAPPAWVQLPCEAVAVPKAAAAGRLPLRITAEALSGPWLVMVKV